MVGLQVHGMGDRWIDIGQVRVDAEALAGLAHRCRPALCRGESCCGRFEVCVGRSELRRLTGLLPAAQRFAPQLKDANPFDPAGEGLYALDTDEDGLCVFAFRRGRGTLCALHAAGLELGLAPEQAKPNSCWLWPLAEGPGRPRVLTVVEDAWEHPCNRRRAPGQPGLDAGVVEIVQGRFGRRFVEALLARL